MIRLGSNTAQIKNLNLGGQVSRQICHIADWYTFENECKLILKSRFFFCFQFTLMLCDFIIKTQRPKSMSSAKCHFCFREGSEVLKPSLQKSLSNQTELKHSTDLQTIKFLTTKSSEEASIKINFYKSPFPYLLFFLFYNK